MSLNIAEDLEICDSDGGHRIKTIARSPHTPYSKEETGYLSFDAKKALPYLDKRSSMLLIETSHLVADYSSP